ncbi:MAG: nicotinate (nicotinamide) nucleotide adenylyltransferase [Lautropia sp.]|nr:nicotinate (nicotinamide) nucleotide adenylyltransferase [Lautropia sp.]
MTPTARKRIGLLGGSFDPVHVGHLALGQAAIAALRLDELRLIPSGHAWQKGGHDASARHRLAMLRLAIAALPATATRDAHWLIDEQEMQRDGASYTIDTLQMLRQQLGPEPALILIIGSDQFRRLDSWHRWTELFDYAHIAVTQRERVPLTDLPPAIEESLLARGTGALPDTPAGHIMFFRMPAVPVSSTRLRQQLAAGQPVDGLLPMGVEAYLRRHGLYGSTLPPSPA